MPRTAQKPKVGVIQATPALFNLAATIDIVCDWIARGAAEHCDLLLFPESFIPCYPRGLRFDAMIGKRTEQGRDMWLDYWRSAIEVPSPELDKISELVKKAGTMVALGVTERESVGGTLYCTLLYFDRHGNLDGKHRKLKPTGLERFIWGESGGSTLTKINCDLGVIGGLICWENYMPLARMAMYNKGVEIYLAPTADARASWQSTMQHVALEGRCFVLAANQFVGRSDYPSRYQTELEGQPEIMCPGGSVIYSPMGEVLASPLWDRKGYSPPSSTSPSSQKASSTSTSPVTTAAPTSSPSRPTASWTRSRFDRHIRRLFPGLERCQVSQAQSTTEVFYERTGS